MKIALVQIFWRGKNTTRPDFWECEIPHSLAGLLVSAHETHSPRLHESCRLSGLVESLLFIFHSPELFLFLYRISVCCKVRTAVSTITLAQSGVRISPRLHFSHESVLIQRRCCLHFLRSAILLGLVLSLLLFKYIIKIDYISISLHVIIFFMSRASRNVVFRFYYGPKVMVQRDHDCISVMSQTFPGVTTPRTPTFSRKKTPHFQTFWHLKTLHSATFII